MVYILLFECGGQIQVPSVSMPSMASNSFPKYEAELKPFLTIFGTGMRAMYESSMKVVPKKEGCSQCY
jgi:hypothetical protein